jgi:hypothetical protein
MAEILDATWDDDGELEQFLVLEGNRPKTKVASPENVLLYDPLDELEVGGIKQFIEGDIALLLSEDPDVMIASAGDEYSYIISVGGKLVETTPDEAEDALQALHDSIVQSDPDPLVDVHDQILRSEVRRHVVNPLKKTFDDDHRISIEPQGWVVDGFYLVDWNAKMYTTNDDRNDGDYVRSSGSVTKKDTTYEFMRIDHSLSDFDDVDVTIDGETYTLTERDMLFLAKVTWLLDKEYYHPDDVLWTYMERWETVEQEEPNFDQFTI